MKKLLASIAFAIGLAGSIAAPASAGWVNGNGGSCKAACASAGLTAVASGKYKNGQPFYICAANAHDEGFRAGYNLQPNWSRACVVGWGGKEDFAPNYKCLCSTKPAG